MRPPDLYEVVCQLSPIEMWYHLHFVPMQEAAAAQKRAAAEMLYAVHAAVFIGSEAPPVVIILYPSFTVQGWAKTSVGFLQEHFTTSGSHIHDRGSIIPHQVGGPAHRVENLVEKDKNPEEWWPCKLDSRNGHCATPSQWSRRKSREISGIVTENTRF